MSSLFGIGFVVSVVLSFPELRKYGGNGLVFLWSLKWVLLFEILFLITTIELKSKRDKLLTNSYRKFSKKYQLTLAKRSWIKNACNKTEFEYLDFIQEIRQLQVASRASTRSGDSWIQTIISHIYSPDAKARITSYIIFFMSLVSLLAIKDSSGLSELMPTFFDRSYQSLMMHIMILSCFLFIIFIGFIYLIRFVVVAFDTWLSVATSAKKSTYKFVDIFVEDMASLHRLPKLNIGRKY